MGITPKTRKILWGRSGNCCAICRRELVIERSLNDPQAIVGDECHIVSKKESGPRSYKSNPTELDLDGYDNLLLLCKTHHKLVDDQPGKYDITELRSIKSNHEQWVRQSLVGKEDITNNPAFHDITLLPRISSGKELVTIVKGAHLYRFDNDEPETQEEMELISNFTQALQDYGDILLDIDVSESIRAGFRLQQELKELEDRDFLVFGERRIERIKVGGIVDDWEVATVVVLRERNTAIFNMASVNEDDGLK